MFSEKWQSAYDHIKYANKLAKLTKCVMSIVKEFSTERIIIARNKTQFSRLKNKTPLIKFRILTIALYRREIGKSKISVDFELEEIANTLTSLGVLKLLLIVFQMNVFVISTLVYFQILFHHSFQ